MSGACSGCSGPLDEFTPGCSACRNRRWWRNKKAGVEVQAPLPVVSYGANHTRVHRVRGSASRQRCIRCPAQAREWAQLHTEDGANPWADYVPMCCSCHKIYDRIGYVADPAVRQRKCAAQQQRRQRERQQ